MVSDPGLHLPAHWNVLLMTGPQGFVERKGLYVRTQIESRVHDYDEAASNSRRWGYSRRHSPGPSRCQEGNSPAIGSAEKFCLKAVPISFCCEPMALTSRFCVWFCKPRISNSFSRPIAAWRTHPRRSAYGVRGVSRLLHPSITFEPLRFSKPRPQIRLVEQNRERWHRRARYR